MANNTKINRQLSRAEQLVFLGIPSKSHIKLVIDNLRVLNNKLEHGEKVDPLEISRYGVLVANLLIAKASSPRNIKTLEFDQELLLSFLARIWLGKKSWRMLNNLSRIVADEFLGSFSINQKEQLTYELMSRIMDRASSILKERSRIRIKADKKLDQDIKLLITNLRNGSELYGTADDYHKDLVITLDQAAKEMNSAMKLFHSVNNKIKSDLLKKGKINAAESHDDVLLSNLPGSDYGLEKIDPDFGNKINQLKAKKKGVSRDIDPITDINENEYFLRDQAADFARISKDTLRRWAKSGLINRFKSADVALKQQQPKGRWLYKLTDLYQNKIYELRKLKHKNQTDALKKRT